MPPKISRHGDSASSARKRQTGSSTNATAAGGEDSTSGQPVNSSQGSTGTAVVVSRGPQSRTVASAPSMPQSVQQPQSGPGFPPQVFPPQGIPHPFPYAGSGQPVFGFPQFGFPHGYPPQGFYPPSHTGYIHPGYGRGAPWMVNGTTAVNNAQWYRYPSIQVAQQYPVASRQQSGYHVSPGGQYAITQPIPPENIYAPIPAPGPQQHPPHVDPNLRHNGSDRRRAEAEPFVSNSIDCVPEIAAVHERHQVAEQRMTQQRTTQQRMWQQHMSQQRSSMQPSSEQRPTFRQSSSSGPIMTPPRHQEQGSPASHQSSVDRQLDQREDASFLIFRPSSGQQQSDHPPEGDRSSRKQTTQEHTTGNQQQHGGRTATREAHQQGPSQQPQRDVEPHDGPDPERATYEQQEQQRLEKLRKSRRRDDPTRPLSHVFPEFFLEPSRANLWALYEKGAPSRLDYDPLAEDYEAMQDKVAHIATRATPPQRPGSSRDDLGDKAPSDDPDIIDRIAIETKWMLFVYHTNWFSGWIVTANVPGINPRSRRFRDLRQYSQAVFKTAKHQFLWKKIYSYAYQLSTDNPALCDLNLEDEGDQDTFQQHVLPLINEATFNDIYGYIAKYVNYQATFGDENGLAYYYLQTTFMEVLIRAFQVIQFEIKLNADGDPSGKKMNDLNARQIVRDTFEALAFHENFSEVDRNIFVEKLHGLVTLQRHKGPKPWVLLQNSLLHRKSPPPRTRVKHPSRWRRAVIPEGSGMSPLSPRAGSPERTHTTSSRFNPYARPETGQREAGTQGGSGGQAGSGGQGRAGHRHSSGHGPHGLTPLGGTGHGYGHPRQEDRGEKQASPREESP